MSDTPGVPCPSCGREDRFATIEILTGVAPVARVSQTVSHDLVLEHEGVTEIHWSDQKTVGLRCDCGWEANGPDWRGQLITVASVHQT